AAVLEPSSNRPRARSARDGWEGSAVSVVPALGASPVLRSRRFPVSRHEPASDYRLISKVSGGLAGLCSSKTSIKYAVVAGKPAHHHLKCSCTREDVTTGWRTAHALTSSPVSPLAGSSGPLNRRDRPDRSRRRSRGSGRRRMRRHILDHLAVARRLHRERDHHQHRRPLSSWTLTWRFSAGQRITQAWNATASQSG